MPTTDYGVHYEVIRAGDGPRIQPGDAVTLAYVAKLQNGHVFDSSDEQGGPYSFTTDRAEIIAGLDMLLPDLTGGTQAVVTIPAEFAFGSHGITDRVPPHATVIYEIDILDVQPRG